MAFRTFLSSMGINAPAVDTVPGRDAVRPGEELPFEVVVRGGGADVKVDRLAVELLIRVEDSESTETGWTNPHVLASSDTGSFALAAKEDRVFESSLVIPWEMPLTHALGNRLKGARCALRTTMEIDNAVDRGDFDEIAVHARPVQDAMFQAFADLGFRFDEAEVKQYYRNFQQTQTLPYCQELEFWFPSSYHRQDQLEMSVITADAESVEVIPGAAGSFLFAADELDVQRWTSWLDEFCRERWAR
ncbi:sporulation protein [Streptomyces sp. TRM S81-3]|uniref:Sporulation protein n=1 Tax=Streptomyces griseicoloratus TaxID=2752516 RepID=A0A926L1G3_9ACTN|nr:sporulation protein [Streptomyces griseicoloratus]MBD0418458.1 sporulation protein [Streptomyces griseicoloratus]